MTVIKLFTYCFFSGGVYFLSSYLYREKKRFSLFHLLLISFIFSLISIYLGADTGLDRIRYEGHYISERDMSYDSSGLAFFFLLCQQYNLSVDRMFQVFSGFYLMTILLAYNTCKDATPISLLMLMMSMYLVYGFSIIKQGFSQSFITLGWVIILSGNNKNKVLRFFSYILLVVLLFFSILFHEAAYVILAIFVCLLFWDIKMVRLLGYISILIVVAGFGYFRSLYVDVIGDYSEFLEEQSVGYFSGDTVVSNILAAGKGIPFYFTAGYGIANRKKLAKEINNYDKYLFLTILCSIFFILSTIVVWYSRFAFYLFFPVFVFMSTMRHKSFLIGLRFRWMDVAMLISVILHIRIIIVYFHRFGGF